MVDTEQVCRVKRVKMSEGVWRRLGEPPQAIGDEASDVEVPLVASL